MGGQRCSPRHFHAAPLLPLSLSLANLLSLQLHNRYHHQKVTTMHIVVNKHTQCTAMYTTVIIHTVQWEIFAGAKFRKIATQAFKRNFPGSYFHGSLCMYPQKLILHHVKISSYMREKNVHIMLPHSTKN